MITKCDINNSGSLDFTQFLLLFESKFNTTAEDKFRDVFRLADVESEGTIDRMDLSKLCKSLEFKKVSNSEAGRSHTNINTYTYTYTYIHIYTHTHTYIYIYIYIHIHTHILYIYIYDI